MPPSPLSRHDECRATGGGPSRGFTLVELLIVVLILGLLASLAIPKLGEVQQRAFDAAALADLHSVSIAIEEYLSEDYELPDEDALLASGFALSPDVSFTKFSIKDAGDPDQRIHIHIEHAASRSYFHQEYPGTEAPEKRWK